MKRIAGIILLLAFILSGCTIDQEVALSEAKIKPYDAIIVPGIPYDGKSWGRLMEMRINWALYLYRKGYAEKIIFSGGAVHSPYVESRIMKMYAVALGVPRRDIYTEESAEHSSENIYYSYKIARDKNLERIAVATDPVQAQYMGRFIDKCKMPVDVLPIDFDTAGIYNFCEPEIDPELAFVENFVPLKERKNFLQRVNRSMGNHLKKRIRKELRSEDETESEAAI